LLSSLLLAPLCGSFVEDRFNLNEASLGKLIDCNAGSSREVRGEVALVYFIDFRKISHVHEVHNILDAVLFKVQAVVLSEGLEVL
jgi:hypothetical protein